MFEKTYDEEFAAALSRKLYGATVGQGCRRVMYGEVADEWLDGHTPTEVKEKYKAELKALEELEGATSDDGSDTDGDGADGRAGLERGVTAPDRSRRPHQSPWLPTPPQSVDDPVPKLYRRKRRRNPGTDKEDDEEKKRPTETRISSTTTRVGLIENDLPNRSQEKGRKRRRISSAKEEDDKEKERPTKTRVSSTVGVGPAESALPNGSQAKTRKRPRTHDVDDEEENNERPTKTRVAATRASRRLKACRLRRSEAS